MAFDEDWDFEAGIAEQCDAVGNESAWDAPWEEDPGSPSVAASPLTSPRLPFTDTQVVDTPSPQVARRELSLSPTLNLKPGNCGSDSGGEIDGLRVLQVGVKM
jgi:hypothetical protein